MLSQSKSESKLNEKKRVLSLPEIVPPKTVRLKFCKVGTLQYISHLDLQRTFMRIVNRACLPVWYTKGFNPHIKMVFSTPLSVGSQSVCEYLDIRIDREMPLEEIKERLNREMTEEFHITDIYYPTSDFSEIKWASYEINIKTDGANEQMAEDTVKVLTESPIMLIKKGKAGEREIDITQWIRSVDATFTADGEINIKAVVSASNSEYLNPEMIITGLRQRLGILAGDPTQEYYSIMRTELFKDDMTEFC